MSDEKRDDGFLERGDCPGCGTPPGSAHRPGCDVERCRECGRQEISCGHAGNLAARLPWPGYFPGTFECHEFGWFSVWDGGRWRRCAKGDPGAVPDLNRLYSEAVWDRRRGRFVLPSAAAPPPPSLLPLHESMILKAENEEHARIMEYDSLESPMIWREEAAGEFVLKYCALRRVAGRVVEVSLTHRTGGLVAVYSRANDSWSVLTTLPAFRLPWSESLDGPRERPVTEQDFEPAERVLLRRAAVVLTGQPVDDHPQLSCRP